MKRSARYHKPMSVKYHVNLIAVENFLPLEESCLKIGLDINVGEMKIYGV